MDIYNEYKFEHDYSELYDTYNYESKNLTRYKAKINFVITHGKCPDGFMSSTIVRKWMIENNIDIKNVTFMETYHGMNYTNLYQQMKNKYVLICDFSFPLSIFKEMVKATNGNILILDHHKTAENQLLDVSKKYFVFDMNHSGAFITWTFMYGFSNIPKCVLYIEDNDIWTKRLPLTYEFTSYVETLPYDYTEYIKLFDEQYLTSIVYIQGMGMVLKDKQYIEQLAKQAIPYFVEMNNRYYFIACVNSAGLLRSELGSYMLTYLENVNFSMIYTNNISRNYTSISYRSNNDKTDVSEIAKLNNGGGHRNASGIGFSGIISQPLGNILDNGKYYNILKNIYTYDTLMGKFIMVNTQMLHQQITKYLIQTRYTDNKTQYQEGLFCMRNKTKNYNINDIYIGSVAWYYDGYEMSYNMTLSVLPEYNDNMITNINRYNMLNSNKIDFTDRKNGLFIIKFNDELLYPNTILQIITDISKIEL